MGPWDMPFYTRRMSEVTRASQPVVDAHDRVCDIALAIPAAGEIFERRGLTSWFEDDRPLGEACRACGCPVEPLLNDIRRLPPSAVGSDGLAVPRTLAAMIELIEQHFEGRIKPALDAAAAIADRYSALPAGTDYTSLQRLLREVRHRVYAHVLKARVTLYPLLHRIETATEQGTHLSQGDLRLLGNSRRDLAFEHTELRCLLDRFPRSGPLELIATLQAVRHEIQRHILLSYNFLFPAVIRAEQHVKQTPPLVEAW